MNRKLVLNYIGRILFIEALFMLPPLLIALFRHESGASAAFALSIAVTIAAAAAMMLPHTEEKIFYAREGFVTVSLSWILLSLFGALPFYISGEIPNFLDCFFETVSGFTTTGASILTDIESMSHSLLYWRSFSHWLGGMGVLVFMLAIAPMSKGSGMTMHLLRAESPGPAVGKLVPTVRSTARLLYGIYIVMTLAETVLLLAGGMPLFDSVTTAFGTAGTGGFSVRNASMAAYDSVYLQAVVSVFMALFGVNFFAYYLILTRQFAAAYKNEEVRLYFGIMLGAVIILTLNTLPMFPDAFSSFHHSFFQVSSIMTTTGFATADFNQWPELSRFVLLILMIFGACAGSTGGGIKTSRVLILFKFIKSEIHRLIHPRSVRVIKIDGKTIDESTTRSVCGFMVMYFIISVVSILLVAADNYSFDTTLTSVLACLNNIGPGLGLVGPAGNYQMFSPLSKIVLIADMLLGRLEIFPLILLFAPSMWHRSK